MKKFVNDSVLNFLRQIIIMILSLIFIVIIARVLGPEGQGAYSLLILIPTLLSLFLNLGIGVSSAYYISKQKISLNDIIFSNFIIGIILSILSVIIGLVVICLFKNTFFNEIKWIYLFIAIGLTPVLIFNQFIIVIFQGLEKFHFFNLILISSKLISLLIILISLLFADLNMLLVISAHYLGELIGVIIGVICIYTQLNFRIKESFFSYEYIEEAIKFGIFVNLSNILAYLNNRIDVLLLVYFLGVKSVGLYMVAVNSIEKLWIISQSVSAVLFPRIASLKSVEERDRLASIVSRVTLFITIVLSIPLLLFSGWLIPFIFGNEYIDSIVIFNVLLISVIIGSVTKIIANYFAGLGLPKLNFKVSIFTVLINIVFNIVLIPYIGVVGAAIATVISYVLNLIIKLFLLYKVSTISPLSYLLINKNDFLTIKNIIKRN